MMKAWLWFLSLPAAIRKYAIIAFTVTVAVIGAFLRIKKMGADEEKAKQEKIDDKLDQKLDKIDNSNLNPNDALDRLQSRSDARARKP